MYPALLSMQAAGMVTDWLGTNQQIEMGRRGTELEQAGIQSNLETARLQTLDSSAQAMRELRQNLGSQIAMQAARGTATGSGTALLFQNESVSNFNADEQMRRMNLLATEGRLKGGLALSKLHQKSSETKLWSSFTTRTLNNFPTTSQGWKGLTNGK